jgi:acyl carrier protein
VPSGRQVHPRTDLPTDYVPPETPTEKILAEIWSEVLGIDRIGVNDSFLELGGNSLVMVKVMDALETKAGIKVNLRALFHQTLGQIASTCDAKASVEEPAPASRTARGMLSALGRMVVPRGRSGA